MLSWKRQVVYSWLKNKYPVEQLSRRFCRVCRKYLPIWVLNPCSLVLKYISSVGHVPAQPASWYLTAFNITAPSCGWSYLNKKILQIYHHQFSFTYQTHWFGNGFNLFLFFIKNEFSLLLWAGLKAVCIIDQLHALLLLLFYLDLQYREGPIWFS